MMRALLMVHDYDPGTGAPVVPDGWTVEPCGSYWYRVEHPSGRVVLMWRENEHEPSGLALWAVVGDAADLADLSAIVSRSLPAREAWRRRNESTVKADLRWWRTIDCSGYERDANGDPVAFSGVREVIPRGARLPDWSATPPPWDFAADGTLTTQANAVIRVEGFSGVDTLTIGETLAGHRYDRDFADEEDPGA